jgi:chromosome segregation ATPase
VCFLLDPTYAHSDSTYESCHLQESIELKNIEIQQNVQHQTKVSNTLEKLKENMEEQTEIISSNEMKLTRIELEKKQKRDEQEQIEAQIKQLQKEKREKSELKRFLIDDIDRLSQEHRDVQSLISQSTYKKNELSKRYEDEFGKEKEFSQTINNLESELHNLKLQINQRSAIHQYQPRHRPNSNNNGKY